MVSPLRFMVLLVTSLLVSVLSVSPTLPGIQAFSQASAQPAANTSTQTVNYDQLRGFLTAQNWQAADQETRRILEQWVHSNGDIFGTPTPNAIPYEVIQTLDRLWSEASNGRFGFTAQQRLWEETTAGHTQMELAMKAFGDRVGWTRPTRDPDNVVAPDWLTEPELIYSLDAPEGHLPWAGISWERISNLLNQQSCGSCTIDAMYLQGDRFYRYLPVLYSRVQVALEAAAQPTGAWRDLQLQYQIDLQSLYPDNACPIYTLDREISPNSQLLAVSSYSYERACGGGPNNSTLALWNTQRGTRLITLLRGQAMEAFSQSGQAQEPSTEGTRIVGDVANAVAFTPDSRFVAAGLSNGTVRVWTTDRGSLVKTLSGHRYAVRAIAISPNGQQLASASSDQTIKLWNLETGQAIRTFQLQPNGGIVHTVLISPDGQRLATATDRNQIQLWETSTGRLIRTIAEATEPGSSWLAIAFSPNSQSLATSGRDNSVMLWNANTGARIITLRGHQNLVQSLVFSPDGQTLASSSLDHTVRLWNLQSYEQIRSLDVAQSAGHPIRPANLGYLAFSPDGQVLATSMLLLPLVQSEPIPGQGVRLWDVATGQPLSDVHQVSNFGFSPNGEFFWTQGQTLRVWKP